jgi:hypothetical protein
MIRAELPNGRVLEFPDGTDDAVIDLVVRQELGVAAPVAANDGFDAQFHPAAEMADALVGRGEELLVDPLRPRIQPLPAVDGVRRRRPGRFR